MKLSFPLYVAWERTQPSVRAPLRELIDGKACLAVFTSKDVAERYNRIAGRITDEDDVQAYTAQEFYDRWVEDMYPLVIINPGFAQQESMTLVEFREILQKHLR